MIDELNCIKYVKTDTELFVTINFRTNNVTRLNVIEPTYLVYFHVDLINGNVVSDQYDFQTKKFINQEDLIEKYYSKFLVLVTYLELTDVTLNIVEGGKKTGDIMRGNLFKNDTKQSVIQVNTNWNVQTISLNSFGVRGHWKLQPCGKGLCTFKHIYIQPYEKGLVRRLSQKELVN